MSTIYFNNFRGFDNTFLHLKDVNFFIGENSTGKTSILKLIGIMSSQNFWRYGEFGKEEISFGAFENIVTSSKDNKDYFEVGVYENNLEKEGAFSAIKLTYIEKDTLPFLKEICYKNNALNIQSVIEGKQIKYRFKLEETSIIQANKEIISWFKDNGLDNEIFNRTESQYIGIASILSQLSTQIKELNSFTIDLPSFANRLAWIAPVRAEPKSIYRQGGDIYDSGGRHSPSVLKEINLSPIVKHILNRFGSDSGLFEDIYTKDLVDAKILENIENMDDIDRKQAIKKSDTFEIRVTINGESRNIVNVGYGVSQILPIIIEAIARPDNTWFAAQQPEVHLHPKAQAAFGDFVFKSNHVDNQKFIIETHSDYIIDRYRLRLNRASKEKAKAKIGQVVFFYKKENGNKLDVIPFNSDGSYFEQQPKEFRDFFIKEQLDLITI